MTVLTAQDIWLTISEKVLNNIKVFVLQNHVDKVLEHFHTRVDYIVRRYARFLPTYVAQSEVDDLKTIAQLELLETLKVWDQTKSLEMWPLAQARIIGAMKDHIRYITKSDPSRFYDWITDAAYVYMATNDRADLNILLKQGCS